MKDVFTFRDTVITDYSQFSHSFSTISASDIKKVVDSEGNPHSLTLYTHQLQALANSQLEELEKFLHDFEKGTGPFTVTRYTGQEDMLTRQGIADNPPDIILTNFMMLELLLTRYQARDSTVMDHCDGLPKTGSSRPPSRRTRRLLRSPLRPYSRRTFLHTRPLKRHGQRLLL